MDVTISREGGVAVLTLAGRLDSCASEDFGKRLDAALPRDGGSVLLDCARLTFISSAGLRILLKGAKQMQTAGGAMALCSLSENVRDVFAISGLLKVFSVHASRGEALPALAVAGQG
jgi:anti-anti-sigma factor